MSNWHIRASGLLLAATAAWYAPWLVTNMTLDVLWLSVPFVAANLLLLASVLMAFVNNWQRTSPPERLVAPGDEPMVAVVIPTAGEPVEHVTSTVESVLAQDWPHARLCVAVSDDAHSPLMASAVRGIRLGHPEATIIYLRPPLRNSPDRRGEAKAGNLNSALAVLGLLPGFGGLAFIETRDADDEVGDPRFLRHCVGQLLHDERVAFVQTIKEARVSEGDPFDNIQAHFYRGTMLARHAANAVFPCGSGVVWRRAALIDMGGFPTWNLVEDLQSGINALKRGWRGVYVPIVGAVGQHAPEDIPNVYKQRGTWALDTMRLVFWRGMKGMNLRQRLHFLELGVFYLLSFALLVIIVCPMIGFIFDRYPLQTTFRDYLLHFWPFAAALELFLAALNRPRRYEALWRARQMWTGLVPVYARACILAFAGGPRRKPTYTVTRKVDEFAWYWKETLVQTLLLVGLVGTVLYSIATKPVLTDFDLGSAYWAALFSMLLAGFVRKSWFGVDWRGPVRRSLRVDAVSRLVRAPALAAALSGVTAGLGLAFVSLYALRGECQDCAAGLDEPLVLALAGVLTTMAGLTLARRRRTWAAVARNALTLAALGLFGAATALLG